MGSRPETPSRPGRRTRAALALSAIAVLSIAAIGGSVQTAAGNGNASWAPSAGPADRAGNLASLATADESGAADKEF